MLTWAILFSYLIIEFLRACYNGNLELCNVGMQGLAVLIFSPVALFVSLLLCAELLFIIWKILGIKEAIIVAVKFIFHTTFLLLVCVIASRISFFVSLIFPGAQNSTTFLSLGRYSFYTFGGVFILTEIYLFLIASKEIYKSSKVQTSDREDNRNLVSPHLLILGGVIGSIILGVIVYSGIIQLMVYSGEKVERIEKSYKEGKISREEAVNKLTNLLEDRGMQMSAITALGNIGAKEAAPKLLELLRNKEEMVWVAEALGKIGAKEAIPDLIILLRDSQSWYSQYAQEKAAVSLGQLDAQEAIPDLVNALGSDNKNLRKASVEALEKLNAKEAVLALEKLLTDTDIDVRSSTIIALCNLGAKEKAMSEIIKLLKEKGQETLNARCWVIETICKLNIKEAIPSLIELLDDEMEWIRAYAVLALVELGAKDKVPQKNIKDVRFFIARAWTEETQNRARRALEELGVKE